MVLVVPGVTRFAFNGNVLDEKWTNILDMQIDTTGTGLSRSEANHAAAGNNINAWVEHFQSLLTAQVSLTSVSWVDLDSAQGDTGSRDSTSQHTLPVAGTSTGNIMPGNVAILVSKEVQSGRGARNGRWYQTGVKEESVVGNSLSAGVVTTFQAAFDAFLAEVNDEPVLPTNFNRDAVVVHDGATLPAPYYSSIERLNVQPRLATQRRRLRG